MVAAIAAAFKADALAGGVGDGADHLRGDGLGAGVVEHGLGALGVGLRLITDGLEAVDAVFQGRVVQIGEIHADSLGTYGAPRIHAELVHCGTHVGRKRIARLMRTAHLQGISRRRFVCTTLRDGARPAPDLVDRRFVADRPDALLVADITYIPTWAGFLYLAIVLDVFSRAEKAAPTATTQDRFKIHSGPILFLRKFFR